MPKPRDDPYGPFNYRVLFTTGNGQEIYGGFSEISGLSTETTHAVYGESNDERSQPRKIPLVYRSPEITLKRGLIGRNDLFKWTSDLRKGIQGARATVVIRLLSGDRSGKE